MNSRLQPVPPARHEDGDVYCDYNGGRPCDYAGPGGKGHCEGCCRCPW